MTMDIAETTELDHEIRVAFRGMCTLVLPRSDGTRPRHARVLFPAADTQLIAFGNSRYTIPEYETYIAIPVSANPTPRSDLECDMPLSHGGVYSPRRKEDRFGINVEAVNRAERRRFAALEPKKVRCALYFVPAHEIRIDALRADQDQLECNATPVGPQDKPADTGETSMMWLPHIAHPATRGTISLNASGEPPVTVAAYVDMNHGRLRPRGLFKDHVFRFLHANDNPFARPIASEMLLVARAKPKVTVTLRPFRGEREIRIQFESKERPMVIVGCEPLDDIVGIGSVQACVEPAYDYELHYRLRGAAQRRLPVPICIERDPDHRSPPGSRCGPPTVVTSG